MSIRNSVFPAHPYPVRVRSQARGVAGGPHAFIAPGKPTRAITGDRGAADSPVRKRHLTTRVKAGLRAVFFLALMLVIQPALGEDAPSTNASPGSVTPEVLEAKIAEVEAATGMEEQTKTRLAELYRKALSYLQAARSNSQAAEEFRRAATTAPVKIQLLRDAMDRAALSAPEAARENENVLDDPAPSVIFEAFGDNSLAMALRCFMDSADLVQNTYVGSFCRVRVRPGARVSRARREALTTSGVQEWKRQRADRIRMGHRI